MSKQISDQVAGDVLTGALEGGIGYWSAASMIWRGGLDGAVDDLTVTSVRLSDAEGEDAFKPVVVDVEAVRRGIELVATPDFKAAKVHKAAARALLAGDEEYDYDAGDADVIVQAAVFGEIVFG